MSDGQDPSGGTEAGASTQKGRLRRELSAVDAAAIMVGTMVGSGIFIVPGEVAKLVPSAPLILAVWVFAGVLILFGAITFAELAAAIPESGGAYAYIREAFGQPWAFLNGWSIFAANKTASIAVLAFFFATYLDALFATAFGTWGVKLVALGLILVLTIINVVGVGFSGKVQTVSTVLKLAILVLMGVAGLLLAPGAAADPAATAPALPDGFGLVGALGLALIPTLFAFDGWANATQVGDEVREPQRNLPLALISGVAIVTLVYVLMNATYVRVLGVENFAGSLFPAADVANALMGPMGETFVIVAILVALFGTTNGVFISGPRVYFAMARDDVFPQAVDRVHPSFDTPYVSIILQAAWAAGLLLLGTFEQLLNYIIIVSWIFYGLAGASVFVLRWKRPDMDRPYKAWGYPIVPALFVLVSAAFVLNSFIERPVDSLMGLLLVALGLPLYAYWSKGRFLPGWVDRGLRRWPGREPTPGSPEEPAELTPEEEGILTYLQDLHHHGAPFEAEEAADATGLSETAVFEALSGVARKRPGHVEIGYWGGELHVRMDG